MRYLLIPLTALLLVIGQSTWNSAVKGSQIFSGGVMQSLLNLMAVPRIWIGGAIYALATIVYFLALSKNEFFVVQSAMTGLSLVFSVLVGWLIFHESISLVNIFGILLILTGAYFIILK